MEESGLPREQAGYATAIICCSIMIPVIISGLVADTVGRRPLLLVSTVLTALVDLLIATFLILHQSVEITWAPQGDKYFIETVKER